MRRKRTDAQTQLAPCTICARYFKLENLSYAQYEANDRGPVGGGRLCRSCLADLPYAVVSGETVWFLMIHAA